MFVLLNLIPFAIYRLNLPGAKWQPSFKNFYSVVNSRIKKSLDDDYKPTAWELLADSITSAKRNKHTMGHIDTPEEIVESDFGKTVEEPVNTWY